MKFKFKYEDNKTKTTPQIFHITNPPYYIINITQKNINIQANKKPPEESGGFHINQLLATLGKCE